MNIKNNLSLRLIARSLILAFVLSIPNIAVQKVLAQDNTRILTWLKFTDARNSFYNHVTNEAYTLLKDREDKVSEVKTIDQWLKRQQEVKQTMWDILGPFPEKTPLNVQITGKVKKDGFTVENLIYESLPGFYVTASLFIPDNTQKPAPRSFFVQATLIYHSGIICINCPY